MLRIVFTCGDINGIGPEISIKTISQVFDPEKYQITFICPENVFLNYIKNLRINIPYKIVEKPDVNDPENLQLITAGNAEMQLGKSTALSGKIAYEAIVSAAKLANAEIVDAIVTAPVSKKSLQMAGVEEPGHTEILAKMAGSQNYCMMFLSDNMIAALSTIHIPLKNVASSISIKSISKILEIVNNSLINDLKISNPRIAVLGLNPHAGEEGKLGSEEDEIIEPAVKGSGFGNISGPFVPDAFFGNRLHTKFDAVVGMYHDQVLIPFKMMNFQNGVNFTAGLPIIRTSPDHGTAFDIAGKLEADESSMTEAFRWAVKIAQNRKK